MNQVELIEALTAKGYSAGFAGTMLVVTVNNRTDVPGVVQTKVKYSKSLPVFIKFRNGDIEPIYYGSVLAIAKIIRMFGGAPIWFAAGKPTKKLIMKNWKIFCVSFITVNC